MSHCTIPVLRYSFNFFLNPFFSIGLVWLYIASLPLRSCPNHWATFCRGGFPMSFFSFLVAAGFERMTLSLGDGHLNCYPILTTCISFLYMLDLQKVLLIHLKKFKLYPNITKFKFPSIKRLKSKLFPNIVKTS